ncbi:hypothetical protein J0H58_09100 [bacterium]|nr:hypothetical protein [bacterium]
MLAALLGMAAAVETVKPEWRDPEYGHRLNQLRALRSAHPGRPLVVAVGSSRTQMGVSPAAMGFADAPGAPLVFNFGQSGAGPLRMDLTVERLAAEGIVPDVLLVEFFPAALAHDGPAEEQLKATTARLSWGDLRRLEPYTTDRAALRRRWAGGRFASWHSLRLVLMSHWQPNWLPWHDRLAFQWEMTDPFGFSPYPQEDVSDADRARGIARVREQYAGLMSDYRVGPMSDRVFRDLLGRCRERGVRVVLYRTPEGPSFRALAAPADGRVKAYLDGLRVPVIDPTGDYPEADFADGHHLLRAGAARFSRELARGIVLP